MDVSINEEDLKKFFKIDSRSKGGFDPENETHKLIFTMGFIRGAKYAQKKKEDTDVLKKSLKRSQKPTPKKDIW